MFHGSMLRGQIMMKSFSGVFPECRRMRRGPVIWTGENSKLFAFSILDEEPFIVIAVILSVLCSSIYHCDKLLPYATRGPAVPFLCACLKSES